MTPNQSQDLHHNTGCTPQKNGCKRKGFRLASWQASMELIRPGRRLISLGATIATDIATNIDTNIDFDNNTTL